MGEYVQGLIFNAIEDAVVEEHGYAAWDQLLQDAKLHGAWTSSGMYGDVEVMSLVQQAALTFQSSIDETLVAIGRSTFAPLFAHYPGHESIKKPEDVLLNLDEVIHVEVKKSYDLATPPRFTVEQGIGELKVRYSSERGLCWLAVGLMLGCGDAFGRSWVVDQIECTADGYDHCVMVVRDA